MTESVSISHQALEQVFTDSVGAGNVEVSGLLVGYLVNGGVHITKAIPTSRGTFTRIPITSEDMARAAEKLSPSEQLVGWYHSHPGHTVFFSQEDIESHETFLQYNPFFKALVIDSYQAKNGDPVADCVKFYTVRNYRAISIDDYGITGSSVEDYYDPREFVFDRNGFAHYRPLAPREITAFDDRELRQVLGTVLAERDEPEERNKELRIERNVSISHLALEKVFTDSVRVGGIEVGGFLVGYPVNDRVHISRAIPTSRGTVIRIPITSEDMARAAEKLSPGERLVGWYHSRPGGGVFFSQDDIKAHEKFLLFNPHFKALIIDPYQAKRGDSVADCVKFYTVSNYRIIPICDYKLTGSSVQNLYDPEEFVFDKYGFTYHRPLARAGITTIVAPKRENNTITSFEYDLFICHASEDKESFVRGLAEKLSSKGLRVWYDEFTLLLGDSLRRKINYGLTKSRYGVVILSKKFFEKEWPQKELDGLVAREDGSNKVILPVWHGVTREQVQSFSPILADRLAVSSDRSIDYVVNEILKIFKENPV